MIGKRIKARPPPERFGSRIRVLPNLIKKPAANNKTRRRTYWKAN